MCIRDSCRPAQHIIRGEEATRWSHRVLQDFDKKGEHRLISVLPSLRWLTWSLQTQSQAILQHILSRPQEKLLQSWSFLQHASVKGSSVLGIVFLSMSSTPPRLTPSRTASKLTGRSSDVDNKSTEVYNNTSTPKSDGKRKQSGPITPLCIQQYWTALFLTTTKNIENR